MPTGKTALEKHCLFAPFLKELSIGGHLKQDRKPAHKVKKLFTFKPVLALLFALINEFHGIYSKISCLIFHLKSTRRRDTISS